MPILYFFGPDGAGKSTLTKGLAKNIHNRGHKVTISWMRGSHTFASLLAKFLAKFSLFRGSENPYYDIRIPPKMKRFWQFLEFLSAIPIIFYKFLIPDLLGYWVLADRYASDLVVWLCLTTNDYEFLKKFEAKILIALTCRTSVNFYVTANIKDLIVRTEKLWFPQEQLNMYGEVAKTVEANVINTSLKSKDESLLAVQAVIDKIPYY